MGHGLQMLRVLECDVYDIGECLEGLWHEETMRQLRMMVWGEMLLYYSGSCLRKKDKWKLLW